MGRAGRARGRWAPRASGLSQDTRASGIRRRTGRKGLSALPFCCPAFFSPHSLPRRDIPAGDPYGGTAWDSGSWRTHEHRAGTLPGRGATRFPAAFPVSKQALLRHSLTTINSLQLSEPPLTHSCTPKAWAPATENFSSRRACLSHRACLTFCLCQAPPLATMARGTATSGTCSALRSEGIRLLRLQYFPITPPSPGQGQKCLAQGRTSADKDARRDDSGTADSSLTTQQHGGVVSIIPPPGFLCCRNRQAAAYHAYHLPPPAHDPPRNALPAARCARTDLLPPPLAPLTYEQRTLGRAPPIQPLHGPSYMRNCAASEKAPRRKFTFRNIWFCHRLRSALLPAACLLFTLMYLTTCTLQFFVHASAFLGGLPSFLPPWGRWAKRTYRCAQHYTFLPLHHRLTPTYRYLHTSPATPPPFTPFCHHTCLLLPGILRLTTSCQFSLLLTALHNLWILYLWRACIPYSGIRQPPALGPRSALNHGFATIHSGYCLNKRGGQRSHITRAFRPNAKPWRTTFGRKVKAPSCAQGACLLPTYCVPAPGLPTLRHLPAARPHYGAYRIRAGKDIRAHGDRRPADALPRHWRNRTPDAVQW